MPFADSNYGRVAYIAETNFGQTPATPAMKIVRMTSSDFAAQKDTAVSNELRTDRMISTVSEVGASSGGSIGIEMSLGGTHDDFLEAALCGNWSTAINADSVAVIAGNKFSKTGAFNNAQVGQWIYASGFGTAGNNGWFQITAKTSDDITVNGTLTVEAGATGKTVKGKMLRNGIVKRSFSIEQAFTDINQYFLFTGQRLTQWSMDVQAGQIVTGRFQFMGSQAKRQNTTYSGSLINSTSTPVLNATSNVASVMEGGAELATAIQSISVQLDNAGRVQNAVRSKFPAGIGMGRQTVTGTVNAYFEDGALYDKFLNHQTSSLSFGFVDALGNAMRVTLPKVYFSSDNPVPGGNDQDVMQQLNWTAVLDPATNCQIQIDMI